MTSRTQAAWIIAATILVSTASAQAGPCTADIAQLESTVRSSATSRFAGPTGQQTIAAQLGRQPTPDSVRRAEAQAQAICMQTKDFERAYRAFVAKQKPVFEGN